MMFRDSAILLLCSAQILLAGAMNLDYLDPIKLQTKTSVIVQARAATKIISKYSDRVTVLVDTALFCDHKDVFSLRGEQGYLTIKASSGVAAVWGFHYYLKKYCNSHIGWQAQRVQLPKKLPDVREEVVANDRFRYYQDPLAASYSYVWWDVEQWMRHVEWMALNGINLSLAPVAQEAAWQRVYRQLGITQDEIDNHFTGPAFLLWNRRGYLKGWGGPLYDSWHALQMQIQKVIVELMFQLGIIPVFPAFGGRVPMAFSRIFPKGLYYSALNQSSLLLHPSDGLFETVGTMFLKEISIVSNLSHIYHANIITHPTLATNSAEVLFSFLSKNDKEAVCFIHNTYLGRYSEEVVRSFLTSVPNGRMLVLDKRSESRPLYNKFDMYYEQPFIWNMRGPLPSNSKMFGAAQTINKSVYEVRNHANSTMIGVGITPSEINQNYVMYELMLESAWRKEPVRDLEAWAGAYAERRYGCNHTADAWKHLMRSVYGYTGNKTFNGLSIITRRPSFNMSDVKPWIWYKSSDLFTAFRHFVFAAGKECNSPGFYHDLIDVTTQALQYRSLQVYLNLKNSSSSFILRGWRNQFLEIMNDIADILATNDDFSLQSWLAQASEISSNSEEAHQYRLNALSQVGSAPILDKSAIQTSKQWEELYTHYYIPRWTTFLDAFEESYRKNNSLVFPDENIHNLIRNTVERQFLFIDLSRRSQLTKTDAVALHLYKKWSFMPGVEDLPIGED